MLHQVHLQAAHVDRPHALGLQATYGIDRCVLRGEHPANAVRIDGPGPGARGEPGWIEPTAFHAADGSEEAGRKGFSAFGGGDSGVALAGRRNVLRPGGWCQQQGDQQDQAAHDASSWEAE